MPESILLEYADHLRPDAWQKITPAKVENSGKFPWDVEDKNLWKCRVRVSATDRAGNTGTHVFDKDIFLDLEKPTAVIEKVTGGGGGSTDPVAPMTPASPTAPRTEPVNPPPGGGPTMPPLPSGVPLPTMPGK